MRGSHCLNTRYHVLRGIIPAYAGLTKWHKMVFFCQRDHPRVCGAHLYSNPESYPATGIIPRMRGSLKYKLCRLPSVGIIPRMRGSRIGATIFCVTYGIIPAYAGLTALTESTKPSPRDHPRVCGAHRAGE